ncbi:hypothetical protein [Timonella senegalensis]|uniref:hypothetical protein n=1 Tax=Timonella senegalensis TaxID=1465825 RepID=UPI0002D5033C|nr:hypothetical protein [Timonella senegalensis]
MDAQLSNVECWIEFPPRMRVINDLGWDFIPIKIMYRAYIYEGRYTEYAYIIGAENDCKEVPMHDNGYPPMPAWFATVSNDLYRTAKEASK